MTDKKKPLLPKNFSGRVEKVIDSLELPQGTNKELLKLRFLDEVQFYENKRDSTKRYYNIFRFLVTIGSIFLPAILSIGQMDPAKLPRNFDQISYWSSWTISLLVTISNGFLQLFSLDKNYFNYSLTVEQLKTEGWQFFGLSGKYEDHEHHDMKAYKTFCKNIENIKRKQIENEFNGKADSKKKAFDFAGEMKKFQESTQLKTDIGKEIINKTEILTSLDLEQGKSDLMEQAGIFLNKSREKIVETVEETVSDEVNKQITDKVDEVSNVVDSEKKASEELNADLSKKL